MMIRKCQREGMYEYIHTYILIFFLLILLVPALSQADKYWVPFILNYPEGTPPIMVAREDGNATIIELTVPGMWVEDVEENGIIYKSLEIPDYMTLMDVGLPAIPAIGGYVGYNETSDMSISYTDNFTIDLWNYNVYPFQEPESENDTSPFPFTINDNLYEKYIWYPLERVNVEDTEIMRDVPVSHFGVVPFQYNPLTKLLKVHPAMTITISHITNGKGGFEGKSEGDADPTFIGMYESLIVNYGNLGLQPIETSTYDYLIVTHPDFETQANDLANFLRQTLNYTVYVDSIDTDDWHNVKNLIKDFYINNRNDYVLLIGDTDYIPIAYFNSIPSDMVYACLIEEYYPDDFIPDIALGRLSVNTTGIAQLQVNKIKAHYTYGMNYDRMLKSLLVAHKGEDDNTMRFKQNKLDVMNTDYEKYNPSMFLMYGRDGCGNLEILKYVEGNHPMFINYRGHGGAKCWSDWTKKYPYDFRFNEIDIINPGNERPVVFSLCCDTGDIIVPECFCERFMDVQGGAVAITGATVTTYTTPDNPFDIWLYRVMYDKGEKHLGIIENWAKLKAFSSIFSYDYYYWLNTHYGFLLLGDPSLEVVPLLQPQKENKVNMISENTLAKNILKPEVTVYPNPSYDVFNIDVRNRSENYSIKLYDISGRLIYSEENINNNTKNTIKIDPIYLGMSQGIYYISVSSDNCNTIKKILYIKE